jgi:hypothetical protein
MDGGNLMTIHTVPTPDLNPNRCLVCHAHRCEADWVSLDVDLFEGHCYLCGDCAQAVTHASGGLTTDQREALEGRLADAIASVNDLEGKLREAEPLKVVPLADVLKLQKQNKAQPKAAA